VQPLNFTELPPPSSHNLGSVHKLFFNVHPPGCVWVVNNTLLNFCMSTAYNLPGIVFIGTNSMQILQQCKLLYICRVYIYSS